MLCVCPPRTIINNIKKDVQVTIARLSFTKMDGKIPLETTGKGENLCAPSIKTSFGASHSLF